MGHISQTNIPKEVVTSVDTAPVPEPGTILQTRIGKRKQNALGQGDVFTSAIFKRECNGPIYVSETGLVGDEHACYKHGGHERAVHQYDPSHYADWRAENPPKPELYDLGGYGENIAATNMTETNVCIGDTYRVGEQVLLQVTEPRHPCYKLNARFQWPRALKRTLRTGRHGWNFRVLQTGMICKGDVIELVDRPFPYWSMMNLQKMARGRSVPLDLLSECTTLPITDLWGDLIKGRLRDMPKTYRLVDARYVSPRVRRLDFALSDHIKLENPGFQPYAFAQIKFGPGQSFSRSYSVVDGDLIRFSLGVALDDHSRGGSAYIHKTLKIGDEIEMAPGANPKAVADDQKCEQDSHSIERLVIIGGIGVTAFLPTVRQWESAGVSYHVHFAVRRPEEAAFLDVLPPSRTTLYAKSDGRRLDVSKVIPEPSPDGSYGTRIFSCGPSRMMQAVKDRTRELGYPEHMVHLEDFGSGAGGSDLGEPFDVEVVEPDTNRHETLTVPREQSLLDVLNEAGFDVLFSCKSGGCGACKVTVCKGKVDFKSEVLTSKEKESAMQSCVDRGIGKICIEID